MLARMIGLVFRVTLIAAALSLFAPQSFAAPVVWSIEAGGNGHSYEFRPLAYTVSWEDAKAQADALVLENGDVGYLATIQYEQEQEFIQSAVLPSDTFYVNKNQVWVGGQQALEPLHSTTGNPNAPNAGWGWVVNVEVAPEQWSYTNWLAEHEPSNDGNIDERFLTMWVHYYQAGQDLRGKWNDEKSVSASTARIVGMIVEYSLPEPGTASLTGLGVALLALLRRRC